MLITLLFTSLAFAGSPFTGSDKHLAVIAADPAVWQNYFGPIMGVEVVEQGSDFTTYQFKTLESKPTLQPRAMIAGHSLGDPDFKPTPENPIVAMVTVGHRPEYRFFRATVRRAPAPGPGATSAVPLVVEDVEDVTDRVACPNTLAPET